MTAPSVISASYFPLFANFCAATGISNAPGTFTISIFSSDTPWRLSSSIEPDRSFEPIKSLNLDIIIQNFSFPATN